MNELMNIQSAPLPAFLQQSQGAAAINNMLASLSTGFPTISIKGKVFAVVRDGERQVLTRPDDKTAPASSIAVVIANSSPGKVKTYYAHGFTENAEDHKPTCFSNNGVKPDASVQNPQCASCALCKHNAFGTARNEAGGFGKGKACSDSVRLAVVTGSDQEVFLLRVPPASLRALGQYTKALAMRGIPYNAVITKVSFDINSAAPVLCFEAAGFLNEQQYARIVELGKSDQALMIIGQDTAQVATAAPATSAAAPFGQVAMAPTVAAAPVAAPAPAPAPKAAPKAEPTQAPMTDAELGDLFTGADVPF